jgi:fucose permease
VSFIINAETASWATLFVVTPFFGYFLGSCLVVRLRLRRLMVAFALTAIVSCIGAVDPLYVKSMVAIALFVGAMCYGVDLQPIVRRDLVKAALEAGKNSPRDPWDL